MLNILSLICICLKHSMPVSGSQPVVVKQAGIGSLAEDDALNILSPVCSKIVCLKEGVPVSKSDVF